MSNNTPIVASNEDQHGTIPRPKRFTRKRLIVFLLLLAGIIIVIGWKLYDLRVNKTITINGTSITSQEVKAYAAEVNRYATSHHENFGGTPTQVADNDLILNAALKDQAKKHNITLTQADIDAALQSKYKAYGSKQAYQAALRGLGIANIMKVRDQNTAYESILQNVLIANKQLFITGIYYNAPYFSNSANQAALRAQTTKIVQAKLLPLFQQHLSKEAIGKQTTVDTLNPNTTQANQSQLFFTGLPTTDMYVANYSAATPYFNESGTNNVPGAKSANDAANSLTKVGQYTPVETFKSGIIGIMRLEGQTKGAYNSWSQLQQQYKAKYAKGLAFSQSTDKNFAQLFGKLTRPFAVLWHGLGLRVFPSAYAAGSCSAAGGSSSHYATFYIRSFDMTTGAQLPPIGSASQIGGAFVKETRSDASTGGGLACTNVNGTVIDDDHPNTGYTSLNNLIFQDNCWDAPPTWSQNPPSGWTWQPQDDVSRNIQIGGDGWPVWNNGNINSVGNIDFSLAYKPPQPPPQPPPPTPEPGGVALICTYLQYSAGTTVVNKVSKQLEGFVTLTGASVNGGGTANWPNDTKNHTPDSTYVNGVAGGIPVTSINVGVTPTAQTASVSIAEYYEGNGSLVYYDTISDTTPQCYQATCSIESVVGNLPDGQISNGGTATVTATVYNNSYDTTATGGDVNNQLAIPSSLGGHNLIMQSNLGNSGQINGVPSYGSTPVTFTITAPSSGTSGSVSAAVSYDGYFFVSPAGCTFDFPIYQPPLVNVDSALCGSSTPTLNGWAFAQNGEQGQEINVAAYVNGPMGTGTPVGPGDSGTPGIYDTNVYRGDVDAAYGIPGNHGFSIAIPAAYQDGQNHTFYVYAKDPNGVEDGGPATITMTGCELFHLQPGAQGGTLSPANEAPTSFDGTATVTVGYGPSKNSWYGPDLSGFNQNLVPGFPGVPAGVTYTLTKNGTQIGSGSVPSPTGNGRFNNTSYTTPAVGIAPLTYVAGDNYCLNVSADPIDGFIQNDGTILSVIGSPPNSGDGPDTQTSCDIVTNKPFFKVYGSGVSAGGAFSPVGGSTCSSGSGELASWNNDSGTNPVPGYAGGGGPSFGAGAQFNALSLTNIVGFASAQTAFGRSPTDLSFANSGAGVNISTDTYSPALGGNFGGAQCLTDVTKPTGGDTTNVPGSYTLPATTINPGDNKSIFVNGDVYISGNVTYGPGWTYTAGGTNNTVPSLVLSATGNIYISPNVTELDGLYIAKPNSAGVGGKIYTCYPGFGPVPASYISNLFNKGCNNQLAVYGNFEANQVNMMRTYGSLRDETPTPGTPGTPGSPGAPQALVWNHAGGANDSGQGGDGATTGMNCTQINEPWDSTPFTANTWDDNYLCVPSSSSTKLNWSFSGLAAAQHAQTPDCTASWGSVVDPYGVPSGGLLGGLLGPTNNRGWVDNYLCSNYPISFQVGNPDPTGINQYCTLVNEPADSEGGNVWQNTYVCIAKPTSGTPPGPAAAHAATPCSNAGTQSSSRPTCAAEVFDFSPEFYLSNPNIGQPSGGATQFKARTALPPVL